MSTAGRGLTKAPNLTLKETSVLPSSPPYQSRAVSTAGRGLTKAPNLTLKETSVLPSSPPYRSRAVSTAGRGLTKAPNLTLKETSVLPSSPPYRSPRWPLREAWARVAARPEPMPARMAFRAATERFA